MKLKRNVLFSIFTMMLCVSLLFTNMVYAENVTENQDEESISDYIYTEIEIQGKDAWGDFHGKWYYKTWTGKPITPKINIWQNHAKKIDGKWEYVRKDLIEGQDFVKSYNNNRDMGYCIIDVGGRGKYSDTNIVQAAVDSKDSQLDYITDEEFLWLIREHYLTGPIFVIRPLGTTLNKVAPQKKAFKVTWKCQAKKMSVKRITGYQIQLSTRKDFETYKLVTVKGYKNTAKTIKKLKSKKKYYVRIRTYYQCKDGFKAYSTWSKAKAVKTK